MGRSGRAAGAWRVPDNYVQLSEHVDRPRDCRPATDCKLGLEAIVSKRPQVDEARRLSVDRRYLTGECHPKLVARRESSYMRDMGCKRAFRIGRSRTGLGLFATAPIKKGAFIVEYKGRKLTTEQADKLEARGNRYLYEINSRWTIDGKSRKNLGRYANHSCRPNAETHTIGHKVIIRALKNIRTGAEITYNYGRDYLTNVITRRGCKCDK